MSANIELLYIASLGKQHHVEDLGKKKFQKLVYLIETVGHIDLGYSYQIHLYGPFSKALDDDLRELSSIKQSITLAQTNRSFSVLLPKAQKSFMKPTAEFAISRQLITYSLNSARDRLETSSYSPPRASFATNLEAMQLETS